MTDFDAGKERQDARPSLAQIQEDWGSVVAAVTEEHQRIGLLALNGTPAGLDGDTLTLEFTYPVHAQMVQREPEPVCRALAALYGGVWRIRCQSTGRPSGDRRGDVDRPLSFVFPVDFTEDEAQRLEAEATRRGVNPIDLIRQLVREALT
jgi:hypothetical protein